MATHAREAVMAKVKQQLERIAVDGAFNWATVKPMQVHRFRGVEDIAEQFPCCFIIAAGEQKSRIGSVGARTKYDCLLNLSLECWVEGIDLDEQVSKVVHDVELILGNDWTQGGTVIDTEITGNSTAYSEVEELRAVVFISVTLHYRHMDNAPSTTI